MSGACPEAATCRANRFRISLAPSDTVQYCTYKSRQKIVAPRLALHVILPSCRQWEQLLLHVTLGMHATYDNRRVWVACSGTPHYRPTESPIYVHQPHLRHATTHSHPYPAGVSTAFTGLGTLAIHLLYRPVIMLFVAEPNTASCTPCG